MPPPVLAIVGPGETASPRDLRHAEALGGLAAGRGWQIVTGGLAVGVMAAAARGARRAGGTVIGILPSMDRGGASLDLSVAVVTGLGQGRNNLVVLSSDAVAVCGMSAGTAVEAALAVRAARPLVLVAAEPPTRHFFAALAPLQMLHFAATPEEAVDRLAPVIDQRR
jgi:uncharacterized protein (TIGR00725 family)